MMRLLLRFGAKTELPDPSANNGQGALHTCVSKGCGKAVLWTLLEAGASLSAKDKSGVSPLGAAMAYGDLTRIRFLLEAWVFRRIPIFLPALVPAISIW
jgi:ankyrin repeat protein